MSPSAAKIGKLFIVIAVCIGVEGHWFLLQTVAWTGMLIKYSQEGNLTEAVVKTFDGEHPCSLCKKVKQGRESEKKEHSSLLAKLDLKYLKPEARTLVAPSFRLHSWPVHEETALATVHLPPVRPPRLAVA